MLLVSGSSHDIKRAIAVTLMHVRMIGYELEGSSASTVGITNLAVHATEDLP